MSQATDMRVVVAVLELANFTAAGARFHLTGSAAAKLVSRVEERLGAKLVTRTTRRATRSACRQALASSSARRTSTFARCTRYSVLALRSCWGSASSAASCAASAMLAP